jgi:sigma-54 dependent transcriptional regulator, flagellar regulatory protein
VVNLPEKFQHYKVPDEKGITTETVNIDSVDPAEKMEFNDNVENLSAVLTQLPEQGIDLKEYLTIMEGGLIRQALNECNGVVAHAAKRLNMRRTTLVEKLRKYDLQR